MLVKECGLKPHCKLLNVHIKLISHIERNKESHKNKYSLVYHIKFEAFHYKIIVSNKITSWEIGWTSGYFSNDKTQVSSKLEN